MRQAAAGGNLHAATSATRLHYANTRCRPAAMSLDSQYTSPGFRRMTLEQPTPSLHGSCHCGAVRLTLPVAPDQATSCNCSLCRRTGGIWAYYALGTVSVQGHPENTEAYIWGDRTLKNVRCRTCGIVTHWEPLEPEPGARHGVNLRNFEPQLLDSVAVRHFDGAETWTFLD
jgi:hypothetical protein